MPSDPQNRTSFSPGVSDPAQWLALTGQQADDTLCCLEGTHTLLHPAVIAPLLALQARAQANGFSLAVASGFRSFARQQGIWNRKAQGSRPVLDTEGHPLDITRLSEDELLFAILRWSAIPGCSRHHWGTDIDIYDTGAVSPDYPLQLTTAEATGTGPFAPMHDWLDTVLSAPGCEFFRPYAQDTGGIAPERWHLSHAPTAKRYEQLLDEALLIDWLMTQDIALKPVIRKHWHHIFHRYVLVSHTT